MRERSSYLIVAIFGVIALAGSVVAGYLDHRTDRKPVADSRFGAKLSDKQMLERRRARVADVAIAGTTVQ